MIRFRVSWKIPHREEPNSHVYETRELAAEHARDIAGYEGVTDVTIDSVWVSDIEVLHELLERQDFDKALALVKELRSADMTYVRAADFASIVVDRDRLRTQVTDLQKRNTSLVLAWRDLKGAVDLFLSHHKMKYGAERELADFMANLKSP